MKGLRRGLLAVGALLLAGQATADGPPRVRIDSGVLVGEAQGGVHLYKGVPFAKPPVGALRWAPPQPVVAWREPRTATEYATPCIQPTDPDGKTPNGGGVWGETAEDCLYLNVYAPANAQGAPVMVWFHGGAFFLGGAHLGGYHGESFAKNGVIVVTANYRLGPLGFFSHPALTKAAKPDEWLGAYGIMDAVAALQWVQRNIQAFGGDPGNVTAFGQSAGGALVMNLLSTPSARGLFAKAGVQSGASLRPLRTLGEAETAGAELASKLGLPGAQATLEQLRAIPPEKFANRDVGRSISIPADGRFMVKATVDAFADGSANYAPLFIGSNNGERGFENARKVAGLMSAKAPAFLYQFAYVPQWREPDQPQGAPHSAEIVYVFDSWNYSSSRDPRVNPTDRQVARRVNSCWVAFARARAGAKSLTCAEGFSWPAYAAAGDQVAVFEARPELLEAKTLPDGPPPGAPRGSMAPD